MTKENYLQDISEIKDLMNKSSKFISLSGLSGIMAGMYALLGAALSYYIVEFYTDGVVYVGSYIFKILLIILGAVLILSVGTGLYLSHKKSKENGQSLWNHTAQRLVLNLLIPLITGGVYIITILDQNKYGQTSSLMLIFYGLSLVNASKYTDSKIRHLGILEIILGLICAIFPGYGFWLWVLGFGILHIIYGSLIYFSDKQDEAPFE